MKRIICTLLIVLLIAVTACAPKTEEPAVTEEPVTELSTPAPEEPAAEPKTPEAPATEEPAAEAQAEAEEPGSVENTDTNAQEPAVYESDIVSSYPDGEEDAEYFDQSQERLVILDDTTAEYSHITYYQGGGYNTYTMPGVYTVDGDTIVFTGNGGYDVYTFKTEGNKLMETEFTYQNPAVTAVQGTYKNADYTLEIREDGTAELSNFRGEHYSGSFYELSDGGWEFMAYDEAAEKSVDYIITLNGDRFSMETYMHKRYSSFAGEYKLTGDLGEFVLTVDAEGNASAYVTISGETEYANGYVYLDYEDQNISGCSMVTEKGEQLELQFGEKIGDAINYFGTMSILLAAG